MLGGDDCFRPEKRSREECTKATLSEAGFQVIEKEDVWSLQEHKGY